MSQFGGGFSSQAGYGNSSQTQFSQSSDGRAQEYLLPITAAMLINAEERDMKLYINNKELIVAITVGMVQNFEVSERKVSYTVMDCSGILHVTKWIDEEQAVPDCHPEGTYIMVYGKPSVFNSQAQLNAYKILKCQSYDAVTEHYLSVIRADLWAKKTASDAAGTGAVAANPGIGSNDNAENDEVHLTDQQAQVLKLIEEHEGNNPNGVNVNWLSQRIGRDIATDLGFLMNEGQIYDTVDQNWVKTT